MAAITYRSRLVSRVRTRGVPCRIGSMSVCRDNLARGGMTRDASDAEPSCRFRRCFSRVRFGHVASPAKCLRLDCIRFQEDRIIPGLMMERASPLGGDVDMTRFAALVLRGRIIPIRSRLRRLTWQHRCRGRCVRRQCHGDKRAGDNDMPRRKEVQRHEANIPECGRVYPWFVLPNHKSLDDSRIFGSIDTWVSPPK